MVVNLTPSLPHCDIASSSEWITYVADSMEKLGE
jgi:hypothetical protein